MKRRLKTLIEMSKKAEDVIIVGAGNRGKELLTHFKDNSISVKAFFDNDDKKAGTWINNIEVMKPHKIDGNKILYIIAVDSAKIRDEMNIQLKALGINEKNIKIYYFYRNYEYMSTLEEKYYQEEIQEMYYEYIGKNMNWENPTTYNEKINWEKLNVKDERMTKLADKFLVKDWIKEQIGEQYVTKLYGVWDDANKIDFEALPDAFVLKLNNGSERNIVVKDKSKLNKEEACKKLNEWRNDNFAYHSFEFQYKDIVPKIICEEYLEGVADNVYDYNIFCFHGEPEYIWCIKGSHKPDCKASFYNKKWEMMPFSYGYPKDEIKAPRPEKLEEMLELSRVLCKDFKHVRVDWYNLPDGRVLFGEMTFSTWSGLMKWVPEEYDLIFGNMI